MRRLILTFFLVVFSSLAAAIPLGGCYSLTNARSLLASEGQTVRASTGDKKLILTSGAAGSGYVLAAHSTGNLCVVSILEKQGSLNTSALPVDICNDPAMFPGAVAVCAKLQSQALTVMRTISAEASISALSSAMVGPIRTNIQLCRDKARAQVICGRTETLK